MSAYEFDNRKSNKTLNLIILKTENRINDAVVKMIEDKIRFRLLFCLAICINQKNLKEQKILAIQRKQSGMMMLGNSIMSLSRFLLGISLKWP